MKGTEEKMTPKNWTPEVWERFNALLETLPKDQIIKSFKDLGLNFEAAEEELTKEEVIAVADELFEGDVRKYFKI